MMKKINTSFLYSTNFAIHTKIKKYNNFLKYYYINLHNIKIA